MEHKIVMIHESSSCKFGYYLNFGHSNMWTYDSIKGHPFLFIGLAVIAWRYAIIFTYKDVCQRLYFWSHSIKCCVYLIFA